MDKNLTDNEIAKALECCGDTSLGHCENCPLNDDMGFVCIIDKSQAALDLINRLQARVEKAEKVEHFADKTIATLQAEIERLKNHIQEGIDLAKQIPEMVSLSKVEAYKEFADRLKTEYAKGMNWFKKKESYYVDVGDIDNLLKELVGEDNG